MPAQLFHFHFNNPATVEKIPMKKSAYYPEDLHNQKDQEGVKRSKWESRDPDGGGI